jgi:hypothetical protein
LEDQNVHLEEQFSFSNEHEDVDDAMEVQQPYDYPRPYPYYPRPYSYYPFFPYFPYYPRYPRYPHYPRHGYGGGYGGGY